MATLPVRGERANRWLACPTPRVDATAKLFCLPYAGGGAGVFRGWPPAVDAAVAATSSDVTVDVVAVRLPGREDRILDDPEFDVADVASAIRAAADRPYALYGHSMGGTLAFEVLRLLRDAGAPLPVRCYVGGARAPHIPASGPFDGLSELDDAHLVARLAAGGGAPAAVLANEELLELLLPMLRADFGRLDRYEFVPAPPLPVPIVAFAGSHDTAVSLAQTDAWARHTSSGFVRHVVEGGHFFLNDRLDDLLRPLCADLTTALTPAGKGVRR
jgi:surfactin synthase thioesterase subunit